MEISQIKGSIQRQIILLFTLVILATGFLTYLTQFTDSDADIRSRIEDHAAEIGVEVQNAVNEFPAHDWMINYWHDHYEELDIEYDVDFSAGTETEEKCRRLVSNHPDLVLKYASADELNALTEEEQKLCAEISYTWLLTRINEIKRSHSASYLFCVLTDTDCTTQFFLFSAAQPGVERGTEYKQAYVLGTQVEVSESQKAGMKKALDGVDRLANTADDAYVDYYTYYGENEDGYIFIGMTYDMESLLDNVKTRALKSSALAVAYQLLMLLVSILILTNYVINPLKKVQENIRLYRDTKDSGPVVEALATVRPNNEIGRLSEDVSELAEEIDAYTERIETITSERERVSAELNMAKQLQAGMLPSIWPAFPERTDFDIFATMDPAREVGGDFYDFFFIDDDHLCMVMADVSGKGVPAALFMMGSKIILQNNAKMDKSPGQILTDSNTAIMSNNKLEMFVTVWLGILELSTGRLTAANAGHEYPIIKHGDGGYEVLKDKHGFVIGGMEGVQYSEYELQLNPGDKLFLYTDGVPEATDADNNMFGLDRMLATLNEDPNTTAIETLSRIRKAVDDFVQEAEQFDDLTMLCMEYKGMNKE